MAGEPKNLPHDPQAASGLDDDLFDFAEDEELVPASDKSTDAGVDLAQATQNLESLADATAGAVATGAESPGDLSVEAVLPASDLDEDIFRFDELFTSPPRVEEPLHHSDLFPEPRHAEEQASVEAAPTPAPEPDSQPTPEPVAQPEAQAEDQPTAEPEPAAPSASPPDADTSTGSSAPSAAEPSTGTEAEPPGADAPTFDRAALDLEEDIAAGDDPTQTASDLTLARRSALKALALARAARDGVPALGSDAVPDGWNKRMVIAIAAAFLLVNVSLVVVATQLSSSMHRAIDGVREDLRGSLPSGGDVPIQVVLPQDTVHAGHAGHAGRTAEPPVRKTELIDIPARELELAHRELERGDFPDARRRLYRLLANRDRLIISSDVLAEAEFLVAESYLLEAKSRDLTEAEQ